MNPDTYYDELRIVMKEVPPLPVRRALYHWIASVWDAARRRSGHQESVDRIVHCRRKTSWSVRYSISNMSDGRRQRNWTAAANAANWGRIYPNRTAVSKAIMIVKTRRRKLSISYESLDSHGNRSGKQSIHRHVCEWTTPPVKGFWSLTLYDNEKSLLPNPLNRFSLGTKNKTLKYAADGSSDTLPGRNLSGSGE